MGDEDGRRGVVTIPRAAGERESRELLMAAEGIVETCQTFAPDGGPVHGSLLKLTRELLDAAGDSEQTRSLRAYLGEVEAS